VPRQDQTVSEMVEEILARQAKVLVARDGLSLEAALGAVSNTEAGRHLRELGCGPHRHRKAREWQESLARERLEEQLRHFLRDAGEAWGGEAPAADGRYSWRKLYLAWLEGKEAREEYYARLERELLSPRRALGVAG
jgi:hypothetical protein